MSLPTVYYLHNSTMSSSVSKAHGGKRKKGYKMPTRIPTGDVLTDSSKKEWIIQSSIGCGGFGEIYTAASRMEPRHQNFVIKIEPSENGPLFCEKTVYIRIGKKEDIKEYMKLKKLKSLGMPQFFGSGIHSVDGKKFRFLVMERYGKDLWSIFLEKNRIFPPATVFKIAIQVLDVLEYLHSKGYVHADIKGANLLLGLNKGDENQVYLVDYGLAARYTTQFKPDPRRAHNGTIEYTSRDGHEGIVTRRGDIEILGYNLLQWLSSNLPWEGLKDINEVQAKKIKFMKDFNILMQTCFKSHTPPRAIEKYFSYLTHMDPLGQPNYNEIKQYMKEGIIKTGDVGNKLEFSLSKGKLRLKNSVSPSPKIRKVTERGSRRNRSESRKRKDKTINISESSSNGTTSEEDFIESTPEKTNNIKRSWKDCPSVVSCAELLFKDDRILRRSKRNK